jgi:hypothetical protein
LLERVFGVDELNGKWMDRIITLINNANSIAIAKSGIKNDEIGVAEHNASRQENGGNGGVPGNCAGLAQPLLGKKEADLVGGIPQSVGANPDEAKLRLSHKTELHNPARDHQSPDSLGRDDKSRELGKFILFLSFPLSFVNRVNYPILNLF